MYLDSNIQMMNIGKLINSEYQIYAHRKEEKSEKLEEHIDLCIKYFLKILDDKKMKDIFKRIESEFLEGFSSRAVELFREMVVDTVVLHDIGKVNPSFQKSKMENNLGIKECEKFKNSNHSMLSSIIYMDIYFEKVKDLEKTEEMILKDFMMMNAYVISKHHGNLTSWKNFKDKFNSGEEGNKLIRRHKILFEKTLSRKITIEVSQIESIFKEIKEIYYTKEQCVYRYIYERIMLSLLIASDFYGTSEFMNEIEIADIGIIDDVEEFYKVFKEGEIYKGIRNYEEKEYGKKRDFTDIDDINILRNEMFLDAEKQLNQNKEANIFYLEAPTGSGKSNVATNLSFQLLQMDKSKNKIFYVYPFNTLVEQNINTLKKVFEEKKSVFDKIAVINSIEPIKIDKKFIESEDTNIDYYKKALLNRQFLNYPMILTTHVTMFKYLFGTSKENIFPLHQLANSIIVLDEIQSYRNLIWGEIITFLTSYAKILNIKIIIMSATLPELDKLSLSKGNTVRLIQNREKYFVNPIFRNRVSVDYSLLESSNIVEDLYNHVKEKSSLGKKVLVEFISKESAYRFYNRLKEDDDIVCEVELMSGDDSIGERDRIIKKVKASRTLILVATQVIEAGVDIDMDFGYKNISILDSEEQFLGRINRSRKKRGSIVYFFKLDEAKSIYCDDVRIHDDITLRNELIREILKQKSFNEYYDLVIERLKNIINGLNEDNIEDFFNKEVKELDFKEVENRMRLIKEDRRKISIYLSSQLEAKGETLDGGAIWIEYKKLLQDKIMDYSMRKVKLSEVRSKMNNFIYEIKWNYGFPYNDRLGELYFIEDGDSYFKDNKLDKEKFASGIGEFI